MSWKSERSCPKHLSRMISRGKYKGRLSSTILSLSKSVSGKSEENRSSEIPFKFNLSDACSLLNIKRVTTATEFSYLVNSSAISSPLVPHPQQATGRWQLQCSVCEAPTLCSSPLFLLNISPRIRSGKSVLHSKVTFTEKSIKD